MSNWFTSTLQTVRNKSLDALEFVRKDLSEFTTTVKADTETYLNKLGSPSENDDSAPRMVTRSVDLESSKNNHERYIHASASGDRLQNEKLRLQTDESVFLIDPTPHEAYESWRQITEFNVDVHKGEIAQLLIDAPHVRSLYARLVPVCTSHSDFWSRYYFRLYQIDQGEMIRMQLLKRANDICNEPDEHQGKNTSSDWDEPDDEWAPENASTNQPTVESLVSERKESDTVSGDSWEREFDDNDLPISSTKESIPSIEQTATTPSDTLSASVTTMKTTENEFDEEWESWS